MGTLHWTALSRAHLQPFSGQIRNNGNHQGLLRRDRRRHPSGQDHHGAEKRRGAQDLRELPRAVHRGEGLRLQGLHLPPRHPQLHVPGNDTETKWLAFTFTFSVCKNSSINVFFRVETSLPGTEPVASPSTATSSR